MSVETTEKATKRRRLSAAEKKEKRVRIAQRDVERAEKSAERTLKRRDRLKAQFEEAQAKAVEVEENIAVLRATLEWEKQRPVGGPVTVGSDEDFGDEDAEAPEFEDADEDGDESDEFEDDEDEDEDDEDEVL